MSIRKFNVFEIRNQRLNESRRHNLFPEILVYETGRGNYK
jgi:hypothetical protein